MRYGRPGKGSKLSRVLVRATAARAVGPHGRRRARSVPVEGTLLFARRRLRLVAFAANTGDQEAADNEALAAGSGYLRTIIDLGIGMPGAQFRIAEHSGESARDD